MCQNGREPPTVTGQSLRPKMRRRSGGPTTANGGLADRRSRTDKTPDGRHTARPGASSRWRGENRFGVATVCGSRSSVSFPTRLLPPGAAPGFPRGLGCIQRPCNRRDLRRNRKSRPSSTAVSGIRRRSRGLRLVSFPGVTPDPDLADSRSRSFRRDPFGPTRRPRTERVTTSFAECKLFLGVPPGQPPEAGQGVC